jgi:hypothetical protein
MDDRGREIAVLWAQGLTGTEIARRMEITRGAVLGKIHRMRESGEISVRLRDQRLHAIRTETQKREAERIANLPQPVENAIYRVEDKAIPLALVNVEPVGAINMPIIFEDLPEPAPTEPVPFGKLTEKSCRFIINSGNPADFLFCGQAKRGKSYCEKHMKLCYLPPQKRITKP